MLEQRLDELRAAAAAEAAAIAQVESAVCERLTALEEHVKHAMASSDKASPSPLSSLSAYRHPILSHSASLYISFSSLSLTLLRPLSATASVVSQSQYSSFILLAPLSTYIVSDSISVSVSSSLSLSLTLSSLILSMSSHILLVQAALEEALESHTTAISELLRVEARDILEAIQRSFLPELIKQVHTNGLV